MPTRSRSSLLAVFLIASAPLLAGPAPYYGSPEKSRTESTGAARAEIERVRKAVERINDSMDALHREVEEWGSLNLSSVLLSPPEYKDADGKTTAPFAFDLKMKAEDWFKEANKTEGTVDFSERILNILMLSATVKATPEDKIALQTQLDKLATSQKLYEAQVRKYQVQEENRLQDYEQQRRSFEQARQIETKATKEELDNATIEREESELVFNRRQSTLAVAQQDLRVREAELTAAQNDLAAKPDDPNLKERVRLAENARNRSKITYEQAKSDGDAAQADLTAKQDAEKTARVAHTKALTKTIESPKLLEPGDVTVPKDAPLFGTYTQPTAAEPGTSLGALKTALSSLPEVKSTDISKLGDGSFAKSLRPDKEEAVFPARSRLIEASGNKAIQEIFNFLGDPAAALTFKDKPILFGVGTVAANPGWRSFADYDGQLDVQTDYVWKEARHETAQAIIENATHFPAGYKVAAEYFLKHDAWPSIDSKLDKAGMKDGSGGFGSASGSGKDDSNDKPLVAAVSPLMERQAMDMTSSRARQDEVAVFLSAALSQSGFKGQGEAFDKYVKLRRQDVATRSVLPVLNAYNAGGGIFGFQFGPRLDALDQPGAKNPKPARQLGKQSFPVLIIFGFSKEDLRPRLVESDGRLVIQERALKLTQTTRWGRQRKRGVLHAGLRSIFAPGYPGRPAQDPSDRYERLLDLGRSLEVEGAYVGSAIKKYSSLKYLSAWKEKVSADLKVLNMQYFGGETWVSIPVDYLVAVATKPPTPPTTPAVLGVFPSTVEIESGPAGVAGLGGDSWQAEIVIGGQGLDQIDTRHIVTEPRNFGTVHVIKPPLEGMPGKQAMAVRVVFNRSSGVFQLRLPLKDAKKKPEELTPDDLTPIFTPSITVSPRLPRPALDVATPVVWVSRKAYNEAKPNATGAKVVFADIRLRTREIAPLNLLKTEVIVRDKDKTGKGVKARVVDIASTYRGLEEVSLVTEITVPPAQFEKDSITVTIASEIEIVPQIKLPDKQMPLLRTLETTPITISLEPQ